MPVTARCVLYSRHRTTVFSRWLHGCGSNGHSPVGRKTPWPPAIRPFSRVSAVAAAAQHGNRAWQLCSAFPAVSIADATMW